MPLFSNRFTSSFALGLILSALGVSQAHAAPPIAVTDERTVVVNFDITIDVLNNDSDPDGDELRVVSVGQPANGTVTLNPDGGITYRPNRDFEGVDGFTYTIEDITEAPTPVVGRVSVSVEPFDFGGAGTDSAVSAQGFVGFGESLGQACEAFQNNPDGDYNEGQLELQERCAALTDLLLTDPELLAEIVRRISPEEIVSLMEMTTDASRMQSRAIVNRMFSTRSAIKEASSGSLAFEYSTGHYASAGDEHYQSRFNVFLSLQTERTERDLTERENGYDSESYAATLGFDYALSANAFTGVAIGNTLGDIEYINDSGLIDTNILTLIAFYTHYVDKFSFDVQLGYDSSDFDISRTIEYSIEGDSVDVESDGELSGSQVFLLTNVQYDFDYKALGVSPYLRLEFRDGDMDPYTEENLAGFDIELDAHDYEEGSANLGFRAHYIVNTNWGVLVPNMTYEIVSLFGDGLGGVTGRLIYAPDDVDDFFLAADEEDDLYYRGGVGVNAVFPKGISGFINYEQIFGKENFDSWQGNAGVRVEF